MGGTRMCGWALLPTKLSERIPFTLKIYSNKPRKTCLIASACCDMTTAWHWSLAWRACSRFFQVPVFKVCWIGALPRSPSRKSFGGRHEIATEFHHLDAGHLEHHRPFR